MRRTSLSMALVAAMVSGCTARAPAVAPAVILSPEVARAWREFDTTMRAERLPLRFHSGAVVRDCGEYLEQRGRSPVGVGVNNRIALQEYLVCDTVALLAANGEAIEAQPAEAFGVQLRDRLDLASFPSSLRQLAQDHPLLAEQETMPVRTDERSAVAEAEDWFFRLEVVAVADVNRDGRPDWIVWLTDEARDGNYRDYAVLVVSDPGGDGRLRAERR